MPFDAMPRREAKSRTVLVLEMMQFVFRRDGRKWAQHQLETPCGRFCLLGALGFSKRALRIEDDRALECLAQAIRGSRRRRSARTMGKIVIGYNDAEARRFADIAVVLQKAKEHAEADTRPCAR